MGRGDARGVEALAELRFPDSLALFVLAVGRLAGLPAGEEGRLEGLAALGQPRFMEPLSAGVPQAADGSLRVVPGLFRTLELPRCRCHVDR
jgi:predicted NodU family carbamoyl transferase